MKSQKKARGRAYLYRSIKSEKELPARKAETARVDFIFSTWGMPALTKEEIREYFPNLKHVFYAAGTVQAFARPFLELGISVHSAWRANGIPVAEVTVSEILLANKGFSNAASAPARSGITTTRNTVFRGITAPASESSAPA